MARTSARWRWALLWALVVFAGSAFPLPPSDRHTYGVDKLLHAGGHCAAAAALANALDPDRTCDRARVVGTIVASAGYTVALEYLQRFVPGRRYEPGDVAAGLLGVIAGVWWHYRRGRLRGW